MTYAPPKQVAWTYETSRDFECDNCKISHFAVHIQSGKRVEIDFGPYREMTPAAFCKMAEMGFPKRTGLGPLTEADVALCYMKFRESGSAIPHIKAAANAVAAIFGCMVIAALWRGTPSVAALLATGAN